MSIPQFWIVTALSLARITIGIIAAFILGIILAVLTANSGFMNDLLSPIQTITKVTPVASFILLVLIWIDRDFVPAIISGIMVLPVVWNNVATGLQNIDRNLLEMAQSYKLSRKIKIKRITVPSVMPYFLSSVQTSIGIGWKAGVAAEVLTVPTLSIGKMIADSKLYMETVDLFSWTIIVIVISLVIEKILIASIKKYGAMHFSKVGGYD
jgi:NitT/TauT family transport system permease protein